MTTQDMWLALKEEPVLRMLAYHVVGSLDRIQDCFQRIEDSLESESRGREFALPYVQSQVGHGMSAVMDLSTHFGAFVEELLKSLPGV